MAIRLFVQKFWPAALTTLLISILLMLFPSMVTGVLALFVSSLGWAVNSQVQWSRQQKITETTWNEADKKAWNSVFDLMTTVRGSFTRELNLVQEDLQQMMELQKHAIAGLVDGFKGMETQSRDQEQLICLMTTRISKQYEQDCSANQYANEAMRLVQMFVENITEMNAGSMELVEAHQRE